MTLIDTVAPAAPLSIEAEMTKLHEALVDFADDPHKLADHLRTFDDPEQAAMIARRSYWHPNGFAKLVLHTGPQYKVRLHVWPAGTHRLGENKPHGHRWNFASMVLCGDGLLDVSYRESDKGLSYLLHDYGDDTLTPVRKVVLAECDRHEIRPHQVRTVDTSIVHTVQPLGRSLVATLVVQGIPRWSTTPVYCPPDIRVDEPVEPISGSDVLQLIRDVLAGCQPQS